MSDATDAPTSQEQKALLAQVEQARAQLDGLARDLRAIDAELEALAPERAQHRLLQDVCSALDQLGELGGSNLFWGERAGGAEHVRAVRGRVDVFEKRVREIEERGQAVLLQMEQQQDATDWLEGDLFEAQEEEERRQCEWPQERDADALPPHPLVMPWSRGGEEDRRFRKSLQISLLLCLLFALIAPWIPLPAIAPDEAVEVPDRVVRMMMEQQAPPPVVEQPKALAEELLAETSEEPPVEEAEAAEKPQKEGPGVGPGTGPAKGILAFREKIAGSTEKPTLARLGSQAKLSSPGAAQSGRVERAMVTSRATGSSGGINLASISRNVTGGGGGGGSLAVVKIERVTTSLGGGGSDRPLSGGPGPGRTDEEIQIVFDRHKAALYRLYNRELRRDPTLQGQMVLRLTIQPDGTVSLCEVHRSDLKAPELSTQVALRVKGFDFGAKEGISALTILYPIDFLPAT